MGVLLAPQVGERADEVALVDGDGRTTWGALDERVDRLVHALRARGLQQGDTVALMAGNQREALEVALACLQGGWLVVPINWHWVAAELAHVLDDGEAAALVVGASWVDVAVAAEGLAGDAAASGRRARIAIAEDVPEGFESYESVLAAVPDDAGAPEAVRGGVMFYTSGTTGHPKGVRGGLAVVGGPAEMWQLMAASLSEVLDPAPAPVQLVCGPLYHSAQWVFAIMPLLLGARVVLQHRFDAAGALELIDEHRVTNTHLVPAQFVRLLKLPEATRAAFSGASLHRVHHGAAPCPSDIKRRMIEWWGPIITEYYGGTEGGFITAISSEEWLERPTSVGRPLSVIEVLVVGPDGSQLPPGEPGDLYFRSLLGIDFEYHKAAAKTDAAHLEPGVGTLGDIGHLDEEGYLHLSDRRIDMIISGGVNIYPAEIEGVLVSHPDLVDAAVFGVPHDEMGEQVMAVVVPVEARSEDDGLIDELEAHVRGQLAGYKCPRRWELAASLPRNEAGKLLKRELRDPYWSGVERTI